jgi:hypothetical protein
VAAYSEPVATEEDLRRLALALPETAEGHSYGGSPSYTVNGRPFLRLRTEAEGALVVFVPDLGEKQALLEADPDVYFTTPHYDGYPAVLVRLDAVGLDELRELVTESWRTRAPVRALKLLDEG